MANPYLANALKELVEAVTEIVEGNKSIEIKPRVSEIKNGFTIRVKRT